MNEFHIPLSIYLNIVKAKEDSLNVNDFFKFLTTSFDEETKLWANKNVSILPTLYNSKTEIKEIKEIDYPSDFDYEEDDYYEDFDETGAHVQQFFKNNLGLTSNTLLEQIEEIKNINSEVKLTQSFGDIIEISPNKFEINTKLTINFGKSSLDEFFELEDELEEIRTELLNKGIDLDSKLERLNQLSEDKNVQDYLDGVDY